MANTEQERQSAKDAFKFVAVIWATKLIATWLLEDTSFSIYFANFNESKIREPFKNEKQTVIKTKYF